MEPMSLWAMLLLAFGLGIVHALDADHVMAVTGMSSTRTGWRASVRFCARWALGHGAALMLIGAAVLLLGMAIPQRLSGLAENAVAVVLILIGGWVLWDIRQRRLHVHFHRHDGLPEHAHWHAHQHARQHSQRDAHRHEHHPLLVGMLHGMAGSAPLLAVLPVAGAASAWIGLAYLLVFGLGVFVAMLVFGGMLRGLWRFLQRWGESVTTGMRLLVASGSIGFGGYLLFGAIK